MHRKTAKLALNLASDDNDSQEPQMELVVRGPISQVLMIQALGQLLSSNDKTSHQLVRGLLEKRVNGFEPSTFTLAMLSIPSGCPETSICTLSGTRITPKSVNGGDSLLFETQSTAVRCLPAKDFPLHVLCSAEF